MWLRSQGHWQPCTPGGQHGAVDGVVQQGCGNVPAHWHAVSGALRKQLWGGGGRAGRHMEACDWGRLGESSFIASLPHKMWYILKCFSLRREMWDFFFFSSRKFTWDLLLRQNPSRSSEVAGHCKDSPTNTAGSSCCTKTHTSLL